MRVLLDHSVPYPLARSLGHHSVSTTAGEGWDGLANGALLTAAGTRFDVFVTCDQNMSYQQNMRGRRIAIVVISTNAWPVIRADPSPTVRAIDAAVAGSFTAVIYPKPHLPRRPYLPPAKP